MSWAPRATRTPRKATTLWGNSTDTANGIFTLNSLGLTASGGYTQIDNNGFDNNDSGNGPFAGLVGLTGTDTKTPVDRRH